ncbi:NERD domain-containing protein [Anaerococcus sp. NML200537]|uniref:NERD domain-containing protein n=1 Tax=Anaerococcus sp. NML200537 TaxID=2954485 RepID=UPI002238CB32|nr:NERD domain-containing protein [Anaerococcus sp. NML200537]MCW6700669.1 NERD domain-containing protein [Anaerococcus sp. NML200537]
MYDIYIQLAIFLAFIFVLKMFLPIIKGHMGESIVKIKLNSLDKEKYKVINNLVLENAGGTTKSTQIDHLVVSTYGIFSIETKNYKGWIYGSEFGKNWTQNIYGNKKTFMNPILQNYAHIKAIENILKDSYPNMKYFSIIAFSPEAEIKVKLKESVVCKMSQVSKEIEKLSNEEIIDTAELEKILEIIQGNRLNISNRDHVKNIKEAKKNKLKAQTDPSNKIKNSPAKKIEKVEESNPKIIKKEIKEKEAKLDMKEEKDENIKLCPKCGSPLEIRTGRYGSFLGCTNYPACTYVESIKA